MLDNMISQNWAGIMRGIGEQIQGVLTAQGIDPSQCSLPPRAVRIDNAPMRLPEMPLVFYWFATVSYTLCPWFYVFLLNSYLVWVSSLNKNHSVVIFEAIFIILTYDD